MPNETINEVILNGEVILSTRNNTVTKETLVKDEIAQMNTGEEIKGELDPVTHEELQELEERVESLEDEAYRISDEEGDIAEGDYIPFNDIDDTTKPKKKILFSGIIEKLRSLFASKTGDNITSKDTFRQNIHTLEWLGTNIPDNSDLDTYTTAGNYRVVSDASGGTIAHLPLALCGKVIVFDNGNGGIEQFYLANHSPRIFVRTKFGSDAWSNWIEIGNGDGSKVHSYETGKRIPANSDLNNYKTTGVYSVNTDTDAPTITNIPEQVGGKLIVSNIVPSSNFIHQFYFSDTNHIYVRMYSNWNTSWSAWKEIGEGGGDSKPHTYEKGTEIPANSDINDYKTEGVYYVSGGDTAETMSNLPVGKAGKLIVMDRDAGARLFQIYMISRDEIYMRDMDNNGVFSVWSNIRSPHTYELGTSIPANSDLNNYKAGGVYYIQLDTTASNISNVPVQKAGKLVVSKTTSANLYLLQTYYVNASTEIYARWYNPNGSSWSDWQNLSRSHSFELGTAIPANSDLNDYTTVGAYNIELDVTARTISNIPIGNAGKLVVSVLRNTSNVRQMYYKYNSPVVYSRVYNNGWTNWVNIYSGIQSDDIVLNHQNGSLWSQIKHRINGDKRLYLNFSLDGGSTWDGDKQIALITDISPSAVGNGYAVATVSGSTITATISGFRLRAGVIVAIKIEGEILTACTLNISSTGAKPIKFWNNEDPTYGKPIGLGCINTMIYDGTYYRIISLDRTPSVRVQNYVADTSGNELIEWGYGTNRAAIKHNIGTNKLTWNYYKNSAWRGDKELIDVVGHQTMQGWIALKTNGGRTIASGAHSLAVTDTIPNVLNELRYSNGAWGSFNLGTAYTLNEITIPAGWYNYFYMPHRVGGEDWATPTSWDTDNVNYGTLMLFGMNNTNGVFRIRMNPSSGSVVPVEVVKMVDQNDLNYIHNYLGAKNLFPWDLHTDIFENNNTSTEVGATHTITDGVVNVTVNATSASQHKGVYVANSLINQMLADCNGLSIIISCDVKCNVAIDNNFRFGLDSSWTRYSIGTSYTHIERTLTFDTSITNNNLIFYIPTTSAYTFNVKNIMVRLASVTSQNYVPYSLTNQQIINGLGASIAKTGKSILPSWNFTTNTNTPNGITYTFNPATGEITANGTATADSYCVLASANMTTPNGCNPYRIPKGRYIITGCPKGGSSSKYGVFLQITTNSNHVTYYDYGYGCNVDFTDDAVSEYTGSYYESWGIVIKSGQTVSNLKFKPMLRPAFTTADYEPCEDTHKGNCYIGTCATAGGTKDKVAYVDGYFVLRKGVTIAIKFTSTNSYSNVTSSPVTLNVNNTGAKNIWYGGNHSGAGNTGVNTTPYGRAGYVNSYVYDGTYWVWQSSSADNNSTNYLRNDASSILTASGAPYLDVKSSTIDLTQANNGLSETYYPAYIIQDKNGRDIARLESVVETNGTVTTFLQVCNYNTTSSSHFRAGLRMFTNKSQDMWYSMTNPHYFHRALGFGYGTCSTAGGERVKVVTMARFTLVTGGIIGVKFSNTNTYSATADNKICLNVNGTGEKPIYYNTGYPTGTNTTAFGIANRVHYYMYDGTNWCWMNHGLDVDTADPRVLGFGYAICDTAEATTAKVATLASYTLRNGGYVSVKFINKVPADSTLNINSRGAKEMWYHGVKVTANIILGGDIATFVYDGTRYQLVGIDRCANYNDVIYKSYNGTATMKNTGVQTLEEITLGAGVWMVTWREQSQCSALTNIAFSLSATKKTSGGQFSVQDGYYGSFSRTGVVEAFTCSFPVRLNTTMKLYAQHFLGGSTALTAAFGNLNITRIS